MYFLTQSGAVPSAEWTREACLPALLPCPSPSCLLLLFLSFFFAPLMTATKKEKVVSAKGDNAEEMVSLLSLHCYIFCHTSSPSLISLTQVLYYLMQQNHPNGASELFFFSPHYQPTDLPLAAPQPISVPIPRTVSHKLKLRRHWLVCTRRERSWERCMDRARCTACCR